MNVQSIDKKNFECIINSKKGGDIKMVGKGQPPKDLDDKRKNIQLRLSNNEMETIKKGIEAEDSSEKLTQYIRNAALNRADEAIKKGFSMKKILDEEKRTCDPCNLWRNHDIPKNFSTYQEFLEYVIQKIRDSGTFQYFQKYPEKEVDERSKPTLLEYEILSKELENLQKFGWDLFYETMYRYYHREFGDEVLKDPDSVWATEYLNRRNFLDKFHM